jgi:NodT family efflux transporter outer membrane factor (OMF) lipoprotein
VSSTASASLADFQAQQADFYAARLSIAGQTVKAWFAVAEAHQQVLLAERTVASFQKSTDQVTSRYRMGIRSPLDVRLSLSNLEDAKALLQNTSQQLDSAVRQLEILIGRYPAHEIGTPDDLPAVPGPVPAGLPAELISRRPDLVSVERRLAASHQRLEAARAALYPRLSLTASGGTATDEFSDLLDKDFRVWSLIGNLAQPIFEGGRLRAGVDLALANEREALALYAGTVLGAYAEVESTLAAEEYLSERVEHLAEASKQAEAAQELAEDRYRSGLEDYITVLESQRRALTNLSTLLTVRRLRLENRVNLYLALGGGFWLQDEGDEEPLAANDISSDGESSQ